MYRILSFVDLLSFPRINSSVGWFVRSQWLQFKYTFWTSSLALVVEPIVMVLLLGQGIGALVNEMQGMPYSNFLYPGVAALTVMMTAFTEVSYEMYRRLHQENYYDAILQAPLSPQDIALGEIFWASLKSAGAGSVVMIVGAVTGAVNSWLVLISPFLFLIAGMLFAGVGALVASKVGTSRKITLIQGFVMVPMALGCGTIFPLSVLGRIWTLIGPWFPLTHLSEAARALSTGQLTAQVFLNLGVLIPLTMIFINLGKAAFAKRLIPG